MFFSFSALSQWLLQKAIFDLTNLESSFAKLHNVVHITLKIQSKVLKGNYILMIVITIDWVF